MLRSWIIAVVVHGALCAAVACAGWAGPASAATSDIQRWAAKDQASAPHNPLIRTYAKSHAAVSNWLSPTGDLHRFADVVSGYAAPVTPTPEESLREIPPAPSSLALGLTALAGFGLYHAGRKVHLSWIPEWYHTGGPQQIGHATPLDLDQVQLPLCMLDVPTPHVPRIVRFAIEAVVLIPLEHTPLATAPRGPPAISSVC